MQPNLDKPSVQATPTTPTTVPGNTLGIIGFIFAFIGLQLPGLILSIISVVKARRVGTNNFFAILAIILNILFGFIVICVLIYMARSANDAFTAGANTNIPVSLATSAIIQAETYYADSGTYPTSFSQIKEKVGNDVVQSATNIATEPAAPKTIEFYTCGTIGNKAGYWDYVRIAVSYVYTSAVNPSTPCTLVTE